MNVLLILSVIFLWEKWNVSAQNPDGQELLSAAPVSENETPENDPNSQSGKSFFGSSPLYPGNSGGYVPGNLGGYIPGNRQPIIQNYPSPFVNPPGYPPYGWYQIPGQYYNPGYYNQNPNYYSNSLQGYDNFYGRKFQNNGR